MAFASEKTLQLILNKLSSSLFVTFDNEQTLIYRNQGINATYNIINSASRVFGLTCRNLNILSARYIQLWDTSGNAGTGTLKFEEYIPANGNINHSSVFSKNGLYFLTGITFGFSTISGDYTAGQASDNITQITYNIIT